MLLGGRAADLLGRRQVLVAGTVLIGVSSLVGGFAGSTGVLVGARLAQGLGAAMMLPAALSILTTTFKEGSDRNKALGVWGGVGGLASAAGVLLGGLLTEGPGWRWVMFVNPVAALLVLGGIFWLIDAEKHRAHLADFDFRPIPFSPRPGCCSWSSPSSRRPTRAGAPREQDRRALRRRPDHLLMLLVAAGSTAAQTPGPRTLVLSTTTSTQDSGLLDVLVPMFEKHTGLHREDDLGGHRPGAGPGRARRGRRHARARAGAREEVRRGGQDAEPAARHVQRLRRHRPGRRSGARSRACQGGRRAPKRIAEAWRASSRAATSRAPTCSSRRSGSRPASSPRAPGTSSRARAWAQTLGIANDRQAYALTDRGTYLAFQKRVDLPILVEKDRPLLNIYSVMEVNPANGPRVNAAGGKAFADFMLAPATQAVIKTLRRRQVRPAAVRADRRPAREEVGG